MTYSQDTRFANINNFNALGWNPAGIAPSSSPTPTPTPSNPAPAPAPTWLVNFNSQGGTQFPSTTYGRGGCVDVDRTPTRAGYTFIGWFAATNVGAALASPYCPAGFGDISVYAQWTKNTAPASVPGKRGPVTVVISGFTEGPTVLKTDKALSLARATNSCGYALVGLGKGLKAKAAKFGNETTEQAQLRRVEITLSDD